MLSGEGFGKTYVLGFYLVRPDLLIVVRTLERNFFRVGCQTTNPISMPRQILSAGRKARKSLRKAAKNSGRKAAKRSSPKRAKKSSSKNPWLIALNDAQKKKKAMFVYDGAEYHRQPGKITYKKKGSSRKKKGSQRKKKRSQRK